MEKLDAGLCGVDNRIVNVVLDGHCSGGNKGIAHPLGHGDQIGGNVEVGAGGGAAQPAVSGNDFVENQQDSVFGGDFSQSLPIAFCQKKTYATSCVNTPLFCCDSDEVSTSEENT